MAEHPPIAIRIPSKYATRNAEPRASPPPLDWLMGTWTVTHSTLSMWRSARNVRISYAKLTPKSAGGPARVDDLVEYEPSKKTDVVKTVEGVDTASADGAWDWRGKGWLFFVASHWEVLAWGEAAAEDDQTERWALTWFAPTVFTSEGLDVYCDRRQGLSEKTYSAILEALKGVGVKDLVDMVERDMRPVEIRLPWAERK